MFLRKQGNLQNLTSQRETLHRFRRLATQVVRHFPPSDHIETRTKPVTSGACLGLLLDFRRYFWRNPETLNTQGFPTPLCVWYNFFR